MTVFFVSSDLVRKNTILAGIIVDSMLVLCSEFVVFFSHILSFVNIISAVDRTFEMAKNNNDKTGDNNNDRDKTKPDYKTLTKTNDEDNKKRMQRKKRFAKLSSTLLSTPTSEDCSRKIRPRGFPPHRPSHLLPAPIPSRRCLQPLVKKNPWTKMATATSESGLFSTTRLRSTTRSWRVIPTLQR